MSQTEKYYRKYRKYKKQYLYYKQYLVGGGEAATKLNLAKSTQNTTIAEIGADQETAVSDETGLEQAKVDAAEGKLGEAVQAEVNLQDSEAKQETTAAKTEEKLAADLNKQAHLTAEEQATNAEAAGLLLQEEGIHKQILALLKTAHEKSEEAKSDAIQAKGDIKELSTECKQLAKQIKDAVAGNENVKTALRMARTHKKGADDIYELSSGAKMVEKTVIGLVNKTMGADGQKGIEQYKKCEKEIHHSVGLYVNEDKHLEQEAAELKKLETKETAVEREDEEQAAAAARA